SRFNERRRTRAHFQFPVAFAGSQGLHHAARHLRGIAGIGPPLISRLRLHAGLEVVMEQSATQLVDRLGVDDMRWHEEYRGAKRHRLEIHEAEEIPEQGVFDQSLRSNNETLLEPRSPAGAVQHVARLDLQRKAQAEVLLEVGFEV